MSVDFRKWLALCALFGCSPEGVSSAQSNAPIGAHEPELVCVGEIQFPNEQDRVRFLDGNVGSMIRDVREGKVTVLSNRTAPTLVIITRRDQCNDVNITRDYGFSGGGLQGAEFASKPIDEMRDEINRLHIRRRETSVWRCVVRVRGEDMTTFEQAASLLLHVGLRELQFEYAGDSFFAANDPCPLLSRFVSASFEATNHASRIDAQRCENSTLQRCGFPDTIGQE
jgi:hypothetical protein